MPKFQENLADFPLNQQVGPFAALVDIEFVESAENYLGKTALRREELGLVGDKLIGICEDYREGVLPQQIINKFWGSIDHRVANTEMMTEKIALEDRLYSMIVNEQFDIIDLVIKRLEYDAEQDESGKAQRYLDYFLDIYFDMQNLLKRQTAEYEEALELRRQKNFNDFVAAAVLATVLSLGTIVFHEPIGKAYHAYQQGGPTAALQQIIGTPEVQIQGR